MDSLSMEEDILDDSNDFIINFPPEVQRAIEEVIIVAASFEIN